MWIIGLIMGSRTAKLLIAALMVVGGIWGYGIQKKHEGKVELKAESKIEGQKNHAAAEKARSRVNADDKYFEQRLRKYCRDC